VEEGCIITLAFPITTLPHYDLQPLGLDVVQNSNFYPFQKGILSMSHPQGGLGQQLIIRNQTHEYISAVKCVIIHTKRDNGKVEKASGFSTVYVQSRLDFVTKYGETCCPELLYFRGELNRW